MRQPAGAPGQTEIRGARVGTYAAAKGVASPVEADGDRFRPDGGNATKTAVAAVFKRKTPRVSA